MKLTITTTGTHWFPSPTPHGENTLRLTYVDSATGAVLVVASLDKNDSDLTGMVDIAGTQVAFDSGGDYASRYVDISGQKFIGIEVTTLSGTLEAEIIRSIT